jgi:glycosyltransferase involved in cell wall biosynthesis
MKDLISIIIPIYNVEKYIRRCIDSVLRQTYKNLEIILIDDGSPDRCGKICDNYQLKDSRIHVIHQQNKGVSVARNAGLKRATGDYIFFLDPDDYIEDNAIESVYKLAINNNADIVMIGHYRVEYNGFIHCDSEKWPSLTETKDIQKAILRNIIPNFVWGKLYKAFIWQGLSFPADLVFEDLYVIPHAFYRANKIVLSNKPLYYYSHENLDSIMSGSGRKYIKLHYGQYLAWREHQNLALKYVPEYVEECSIKSAYAGMRALFLSDETNDLSMDKKQGIRNYLIEVNSKNWPLNLRIAKFIVLHPGLIFTILSRIQQKIIEHQIDHRKRKAMESIKPQ